MKFAAAIVAVIACSTAVASDPGTPRTLEDWQVVDVAYTLEQAAAPVDCGPGTAMQCTANTAYAIDAQGFYWTTRIAPWITDGGNRMECGGGPWMNKMELVRCTADFADCVVVAAVPDSCYYRPEGGTYCRDTATPRSIWVDNVHGLLYFVFKAGVPDNGQCFPYPVLYETIRVSGLPRLHSFQRDPAVLDVTRAR